MAGALDEDTARTIASGRDAVGTVLSTAQQELKKAFLVFVVVMMAAIFAMREYVWDWLKQDVLYARMDEATREATEVVAVTPFDVILLQIKIGLVAGVAATIPVLVWLGRDTLKRRGVWPSEHIPRWKLAGVGAMIVLLFAGGTVYSYRLFFPLMFEFLASNSIRAGFAPTYSIVMWTEFIVFLTISFGLAAQMPLAMSGSALAGIVPYETFRDNWRYAVLGIFVFGALLSPPDPFTQILWAVPLVSLYWVSLGVTRLAVLTHRSGARIPMRAVVRARWNVLAGTVVLVGGGVYAYLTRGGLGATNDLLETIGSDYRFPTAGELDLFGLAPDVTAGVYAGVVAALATGVALFYLRIKALEHLEREEAHAAIESAASPAADETAPGADEATGEPGPEPAEGPAEIDLAAMSEGAIRGLSTEAFATLTEDEAVEYASRAIDADEPEKAQLILDRFDEAEEAIEAGEIDPDPDEDGSEEAEGGSDDPITSTTAGMLDAFTEEETTEDDIGGYYYDIRFIADSVFSKSIWIVGLFMFVLAVSFIFLFRGGIEQVVEAFLSGMPAELVSEVEIVELHPVEALIFIVKFSTLLGFVAILPLLSYFAWPAIEQRNIATGNRNYLLVWGGSILVSLVGGTLLGFFYIAPTVISWLAQDVLTSNMLIAYRINNFGWLVVYLTVFVGFLAAIPVTMWLFHRGSIVSYATMRRRWRVFVLGVFAVGGFLSPKGVFTMFLIAIPAAFAYGIGLATLWVLIKAVSTVSRPRGEPAD